MTDGRTGRTGVARACTFEELVEPEHAEEDEEAEGPAEAQEAQDAQEAQEAQRRLLDSLLKPKGALGVFEDMLLRLAAITGRCYGSGGDVEPSRPAPFRFSKVAVLAASDHGVVAEGVSPYPFQVTAEVLRAALQGKAGIAAACRATSTKLVVLDMGVLRGRGPGGAPVVATADLVVGYRGPTPSGNITRGPAMTEQEALDAVEAGRSIVRAYLPSENPLLVLGEAGIGNTTVASAICAALLRTRAEDVVGPGSGADPGMRRRKVMAVERALAVNRPDPSNPIQVLARVGGREIAALCGCCIQAAVSRVPVILDGFVCSVAALAASRVAPDVRAHLFASHLSPEPGHARVLDDLGLTPVLRARLGLGEGLGGLLFASLLENVIATVEGMGTLSEMGLVGPETGGQQ